jgi:hypothetical protein
VLTDAAPPLAESDSCPGVDCWVFAWYATEPETLLREGRSRPPIATEAEEQTKLLWQHDLI